MYEPTVETNINSLNSSRGENVAHKPDVVSAPDPVTVPLDVVIRAIRSDSRLDPEQFLEEVVIPGGGE